MSKLPRVPRRIGPEAFFTRYLPELWQAFCAEGSWQWPEGEAQLHANIDGEDFTLTGWRGTISGRKGSTADALLHVRCDADTFQVASGDVLPRLIAHAEAHLHEARASVASLTHQVKPSRLAALRARPGSVSLHYTDDAGDVSTLHITVGSGQGPRAEVRLADTDLDALIDALAAADRSTALARLLRSRVVLEGDSAYLMGLLR